MLTSGVSQIKGQHNALDAFFFFFHLRKKVVTSGKSPAEMPGAPPQFPAGIKRDDHQEMPVISPAGRFPGTPTTPSGKEGSEKVLESLGNILSALYEVKWILMSLWKNFPPHSPHLPNKRVSEGCQSHPHM